FLFSNQQIRAAYAAVHIAPNKRFLILSGLSGTGKTQMLLSFAESYVLASDLNPQEHIVKVSVSPDWRDPSPLLGYINPIFEQGNQKTYVNGEITQFLLRAARYPLLPFFLILDEMNLARVERYFAPFLSGMETPSQPLMLHEDRGQPSGVPSQIDRWPCNLFIGGSVNMDETTHAFSDKVLDRAFTMEYWHIDLERYLDEQQSSISSETRTILIGLYRSLVQAHCHFGYRTVNELLQFVEKAMQMEGSEIERELLDQAICAKILPKIRGQYSTDLERALQESMRICSTHSLPISRSKLSQMLHRLQEFGLTRFWS
ncbi:MAG: ATP-binding protein, partial [Myxococcota bacterium]|nr:ATP-binding protein [Myxococcota bacterium]